MKSINTYIELCMYEAWGLSAYGLMAHMPRLIYCWLSTLVLALYINYIVIYYNYKYCIKGPLVFRNQTCCIMPLLSLYIFNHLNNKLRRIYLATYLVLVILYITYVQVVINLQKTATISQAIVLAQSIAMYWSTRKLSFF